MLQNRKILLGVCGGIAAYKSIGLVRELQRLGADVRVIMTESAREFLGALSFRVLTGHPVETEIFPEEGTQMRHIELARWADLLLISPASSNTIAKMACGIADNLLLSTCLAGDMPIAVSPAMNAKMFAHPTMRDNLRRLVRHGVQVWGPESGEQACGEVGQGRLLETGALLERVCSVFPPPPDALKVVVSAGPTFEKMDEVRGLFNLSSGKMGYAIAQGAREINAQVTLISGPVALPTPLGVHRVNVLSADEMCSTVLEHTKMADIFVACAAVGDYRPETRFPGKMKSDETQLLLKLLKTRDILSEVAARKPCPFLVGFAAEVENMEENARTKLRNKRLDMIVGNLLSDGVGTDVNQLEVYWQGGGKKAFGSTEKPELGRQLVRFIFDFRKEQLSVASRQGGRDARTPGAMSDGHE